MKLIFLDIDGVVVTRKEVLKPIVQIGPRCGHELNKESVSLLNQLCDETGAKVIISSTWRQIHQLADIRGHFKNYGATFEIVDKTPKMCMYERGDEIAKFLENVKVDSFVIIDDDSDMGHLIDKLVKTSFDTGFTKTHLQKAEDILNAKS